MTTNPTTSDGTPITDEMVEAFADEAEATAWSRSPAAAEGTPPWPL